MELYITTGLCYTKDSFANPKKKKNVCKFSNIREKMCLFYACTGEENHILC